VQFRASRDRRLPAYCTTIVTESEPAGMDWAPPQWLTALGRLLQLLSPRDASLPDFVNDAARALASGKPYLYLANFSKGRSDTYDNAFNPVNVSQSPKRACSTALTCFLKMISRITTSLPSSCPLEYTPSATTSSSPTCSTAKFAVGNGRSWSGLCGRFQCSGPPSAASRTRRLAERSMGCDFASP